MGHLDRPEIALGSSILLLEPERGGPLPPMELAIRAEAPILENPKTVARRELATAELRIDLLVSSRTATLCQGRATPLATVPAQARD